ncbi:MAG: protoheme IX farnesyltransferase [Acidobacteria bacterium]|nr:protoheme IX farnesyltransferase [Acidobacteriota bacterium]
MSTPHNSLASTFAQQRTVMADFAELTKPSVTGLILFSTVIGFYLASSGSLDFALLFHTLLGTGLVAGGTAALNQYWERDTDALMYRTRNRPLPAGRMQAWKALAFGAGLALAGTIYLIWFVNGLSSLLAAATLISYLFLYTPLKTRTPHSTLVGSFPGAIPPLIGWAAVAGELPLAAWVLYAILFLWQFPHFLAIAWLYQEDYARASIVMLPVAEPDGKSTGRQIILCTLALLPVSLVPTWLGVTGNIYLVGTLLAGFGYLYYGLLAARRKTKPDARRLLLASVIYLPIIYALMLIDKVNP